MFGMTAVCYVRLAGVDHRTALLTAIERSNRLLLSRLRRTR